MLLVRHHSLSVYPWFIFQNTQTTKQTVGINIRPTVALLTPTIPTFVPQMNLQDLRDDVTIVTAYFNLGTFQKGELAFRKFSPSLYRTWMKIFGKIRNPVVAYFDDDTSVYFEKLRAVGGLTSNLTRVTRIEREKLWSFTLRDNISRIYQTPDYPVHHPNTVIPEYACAMHAKYELMYQTLMLNPFRTKHFAWLDIGLFRDLNEAETQFFQINPPPDFDENAIAYTDVWRAFRRNISDDIIFKANLVWVCGCFFIGKIDVMFQWVIEYMQFTENFIRNGLMNSDQQVIFAMFSNYSPKSKIQTYFRHNSSYDEYFYLGYKCKESRK